VYVCYWSEIHGKILSEIQWRNLSENWKSSLKKSTPAAHDVANALFLDPEALYL
jgi:hypothetical protein